MVPACLTTWAPPETLRTSAGQPVYVDAPIRGVPLGKSILLLGKLTVIWPALGDMIRDPRNIRSDSLNARLLGVLIAPDGKVTPVSRPPFMGTTSAVWALPASQGVHVVWGVPVDTPSTPLTGVTSVWYSRFDGARWTAPERAMSGRHINWWATISSVVSMGDDVVIAAPVMDSGWVGVWTARRTAGRWSSAKIPTHGFAPSSLTMASDNTRIVLLYMSSAPSKEVGSVSLYAHAMDRQGTWTAPVVTPLARGVSNWPSGVWTSDGTFHVFWVHQLEGTAVQVLQHSASRDLRQWRGVDELRLDGGAVDLDVAAVTPSVATVIMRTLVHSGINITDRTAEGFQPIRELTFLKADIVPTLASLGRDRLMLTWGAVWSKPEPDSSVSVGPVTIYAMGSRACR